MPTRLAIALHHARRRRRRAESFDEFGALISAPVNLGSQAAGGSGFVLNWPGNARSAVSSSGAVLAGQIKLNGASVAAGAAGAVLRGPFVYEGKALTITTVIGLAAGTLTIYALDEWNRKSIVATATVT